MASILFFTILLAFGASDGTFGWTSQSWRASSSPLGIRRSPFFYAGDNAHLVCPESRIRSSGTTTGTVLFMGLRGKKLRRLKREARKDPTPPRIETPYGPIRIMRPPTTCHVCQGRGVIRCSVCEGRGVVRATGLSKHNALPKTLVSSQWTSVEVYRGHRHHTIMEVMGSAKSADSASSHRVRMRNCCGPTSDFWIPVQELRDKRVWRRGWLTLEDILQADGGPLVDARVCFRCKGGKILRCVDCDGQGEIPSYEPLYD